MENLQIFNYNGNKISFQKGKDLMINATEMARSFGKLPHDWLRLPASVSFIEALAIARKSRIGDIQAVITQKGGVKGGGGTWMHEDIAIEFARWLSPEFAIWCNDRLKELFKHGATAINPDELLNPDFIIRLASELKKERAEKQNLLETNAIQEKVIKEAAPKVKYHDEVMQSCTLIQTNVIAKELGMSATTLNKLLHEKKIIYRSGYSWVLYHNYQMLGYTGTKTHVYYNSYGIRQTSVQTYWTELGREFIHNLFANKQTA